MDSQPSKADIEAVLHRLRCLSANKVSNKILKYEGYNMGRYVSINLTCFINISISRCVSIVMPRIQHGPVLLMEY